MQGTPQAGQEAVAEVHLWAWKSNSHAVPKEGTMCQSPEDDLELLKEVHRQQLARTQAPQSYSQF